MRYVVWLMMLVLLAFLSSCNGSATKIKSSKVPQYDSLTYKVYKVDGGWGYDVLINGKVYIHQPFIPAVQGGFPFRTREDARKVAILVIEKLMTRRGMPRVKVEELQELGVLYDTVLCYQQYMDKYLHAQGHR